MIFKKLQGPAGSFRFSRLAGLLSFFALSTAFAQTLTITNSPFNASTGSADNASAIQAAINAVGSGGTVVVPSGTFLSGPLTLKSNMTFQIAAGGELQMTAMGTFPQNTDFLFGSGLSNITINGSGVMDGQGQAWWTAFNNGGTDNRPPAMIELTGCTGVTVEGITVQNSPKFHIQFLGNGTNILAQALSITAPWPSPNTDGIDLRGTNVNIKNCFISDGDDVVQIGGSNACSGITVTGCTFGTGHGLSIGSITKGNVSNVLVDSCTFNGTQYGLRLKSNNTEGGVTSNITYSNITMTGILNNPILMFSYYPTVPSSPATDTGSAVNSTTPFWENIKFQNVTASQASSSSANVGILWGLPQAPVSNVLFDACTLTGSKIMEVYNTQGVTFDCNCLINGKAPSNSSAVTTFNISEAGPDDVQFPSCGSNPTPTKTNTPVPPTPTHTNTPVPPTATFTFTATHTNTPIPPTATFTPTKTNTPVPPTATFTSTATSTATRTNTSTFTFTSTATNTATHTNTPIPPTSTNTPVPPTATFTFTSTKTNTPVPPTATNTPVPPTATNTPVPPTATFTFTSTKTNTPIPPTATNTPVSPTATNTSVPPTATNSPVPPTSTNTSVPPTATNTSIPPTATSTFTSVPPTVTNSPAPPTATNTSVPPTATNTAVPPTATSTFTSVPPTATNSPIPPTSTNTPVPPTNTSTAVPPTATFTTVPPTLTNTPVPPTATHTAVPPTATHTSVPPTATNTPVPPTMTFTPTKTNTPVPPTATHTPTPMPPTATFTPALPTPTPTTASVSTSFEVQLLSGVTSDTTNSPHPQIQVVNTGTGPLNLNNVTVKYWFNCDCTNQTIQAWVDWAGLIKAGTNETANVQISVQPTSLGGQTDYILYSFTGNLVLQPGEAIQIQSRFNKSDWSNMTQSNDYSFAPNTSFVNDTKVTGYLGGSLAWGQEPRSTAAALAVSSALAFPNPSTGSGATLSFNISGGASGISQDSNAKVTLGVYTLGLRLIWSETLTGGAYGTSGKHEIFWNEKDLKGAGLANGVYYLKVTVQSNGQTSTTITKILITG